MKQYACVPANADNLLPDFFLDASSDELKTFKHIGGAGVASTGGDRKVAGLFAKIEKHLSKHLVKKTNAVFLFDINGAEESAWYLDLKNGSGKCGKGIGDAPADATLTMDSQNFFDMFAG